MVKGQIGKENIHQMLNDAELMERHRLDCEGIMAFLIRDVLAFPTQCKIKSGHNANII